MMNPNIMMIHSNMMTMTLNNQMMNFFIDDSEELEESIDEDNILEYYEDVVSDKEFFQADESEETTEYTEEEDTLEYDEDEMSDEEFFQPNDTEEYAEDKDTLNYDDVPDTMLKKDDDDQDDKY